MQHPATDSARQQHHQSGVCQFDARSDHPIKGNRFMDLHRQQPQPITLTEVAARKLESSRLNQNPVPPYVRIGTRPGGCSGLSYTLDFEHRRRPEDLAFESRGHQLLCDPDSYAVLQGLIIDYSDDLMKGGFKFRNPNATRTCGCGSSFQTQ
ncbi:MAG: iron-sulfur cluster assembly accessory protein [Candidatus Neomarinimicrobiota bacterium]|nr:MAG: iron-sulfur cluster assembly accessory protein [Candidatus Neomarinimicrobiota bacterium]